jgi:hypothetical protein
MDNLVIFTNIIICVLAFGWWANRNEENWFTNVLCFAWAFFLSQSIFAIFNSPTLISEIFK